MLLQADAAALEVRVAAYLSQDPVLINEIVQGFDMHTDNQNKFGLPSRLIAKVFVFRTLYGGSAYSFSKDADFADVGFSEKRWQQVIDEFYAKYKGLHAWHKSIVREVISTGKLVMPTGRIYEYEPTIKRGERIWPRTTILNYPVQGLGADLMALARVSFSNRLNALKLQHCKQVNTVHDSIIVDCADEHVDILATTLESVFEDVPLNFQKLFGKPFNVPMKCEVQVGPNWHDMEVWKKS